MKFKAALVLLWEYKLDGKKLTLKPVANPGVEFSFERLP